MSLQPARMARADLRHVAVTPLLRTTGASRGSSVRAGTVSRTPRRAATSPARPATGPGRPATSPARPTTSPARPATGPARHATQAVRTATQAVRTAAPATAWIVLDQRVRSRLRPAAVTLAVILVGTMLGLVYLTQTLAAASARYKVDTLLIEREALMRTLKSQEGTIAGWGSEARVIQWAQQEGLHGLGASLPVRAR
jgi:hypothetical protein